MRFVIEKRMRLRHRLTIIKAKRIIFLHWIGLQ